MNYIAEHPYISTGLAIYLAGLCWLAWRYLKPPKDPPPSGHANITPAFAGGLAD
jgi:hypothetical protein